MRFGLIFSLILAILAVLFALANPGTMAVDFVFFETRGSTALILLLTFGFGVVVGLLCTLPTIVRKRRKLKSLQNGKNTKADDRSSSATQKTASDSSGPGGTA